MPALPSVSVCIPVYRGEQFLAETIRSVLDQTYRDFELVVLDNASPDDSGRIARSFGDHRIRVETNLTTLPQQENWREAVRLCRAPLIKLVCADDLLHPRCLEYQVGPMEADLVLFRRAHYFAVGGWRPDHRFVMDLDLWVRLLQHGEFLGLPETLAAFRIGQDSLSADNEATIYAQQKAYIEELGATPHLQVRASDMLMGRMRAPLGRARRRALFRMSRSAARRDERLQHATAGT